jgi:thioredoxin reductase (NADPH)
MELPLPSREEGTPKQELYDVVVIGGGPAGSTAALYAARAALSTLVVDQGIAAGALAQAERIANYPGLPGETSGLSLLERIRGQAAGFGARFVDDKVILARLGGETKEVRGTKGVWRGRAVIVSTGSMGREKTVPGEERLTGRGVSYCATCDGFFFRDAEVAVAGATDAAAEEALFLTKFAKRIHLLVPTERLRTSPRLVEEVEGTARIEVHLRTSLREIVGEERVEAVRFAVGDGGETTLPVAGVFLYLQGARPITDFLEEEVALGEDGCVVVDEKRQTSVPGVFAAGDVTCVRLRQAVIAAADGAIAAAAAERYLAGRKALRRDWSRPGKASGL